jgi:hypothetical protein
MAVEDGVDGASGRHPNVAGEPPEQELSDLARAPVRLVALEGDDQALDLVRRLVGIAYRPAGAVAQSGEPVILVAVKDLVPGLARDPELPAHIRHGLAVQKTRDEAKALVHHRTLFPRHRHVPLQLQGDVLPICPAQTVTCVSGRSQKHSAIFGSRREAALSYPAPC